MPESKSIFSNFKNPWGSVWRQLFSKDILLLSSLIVNIYEELNAGILILFFQSLIIKRREDRVKKWAIKKT